MVPPATHRTGQRSDDRTLSARIAFDPRVNIGHVLTTITLLFTLVGGLLWLNRMIERNRAESALNEQSIKQIQQNRFTMQRQLERIEGKVDEANRFLRNRATFRAPSYFRQHAAQNEDNAHAR